jgi:prepilin-type processing-associated H-X9-DG protein
MNEAVKVTKTCGLAVASLILGVLSLVCFGVLTGVPAVICGHLAKSKIKHSGGTLDGDGLAIGGLITGYIGIFFVSIAILGIMAGMMLPAVAMARERARRAKCMSNLSQLGKACQMYSLDHPETALNSHSQIIDLLPEASAFICPSSDSQPGELNLVDQWADYVMVTNLLVSSSSESVRAYCKPENHRGQGCNVLHVDGSVVWVLLSDFAELTCDVASHSKLNTKK